MMHSTASQQNSPESGSFLEKEVRKAVRKQRCLDFHIGPLSLIGLDLRVRNWKSYRYLVEYSLSLPLNQELKRFKQCGFRRKRLERALEHDETPPLTLT